MTYYETRQETGPFKLAINRAVNGAIYRPSDEQELMHGQ
jgi:hypothetical protein